MPLKLNTSAADTMIRNQQVAGSNPATGSKDRKPTKSTLVGFFVVDCVALGWHPLPDLTGKTVFFSARKSNVFPRVLEKVTQKVTSAR